MQSELGERLGVSFQAVSKWERSESLPDISLLPDLAAVPETTIDNILCGGERIARFQRKITVTQLREGLECFVKMGELPGKDNLFHIGAVEGVDRKKNMDLAFASQGFATLTEYKLKIPAATPPLRTNVSPCVCPCEVNAEPL